MTGHPVSPGLLPAPPRGRHSENQGTQALFMSCVICDEPRYWRLPFAHNPDVTRWRAEAGDDAEYEWRLCRRCGNAYPSHQPRLAVLQRIWNASRSDDCLATDAKDTAWSYRRAISRAGASRSFRLFAPLAVNHPRRFLDIGCGLGETVRIFADNGWDAEGVDADPSTARFHRELGIRVRIGQFEQIETTSEVRSHSYRPRNLLHHRSDGLYPRRARAARGRVGCSASCLRISWRTPTLPYRHMFTPFFRPRHQCVMRFRSLDSKRYSVGVCREAYSWPPAPRRPRPGRSSAQ